MYQSSRVVEERFVLDDGLRAKALHFVGENYPRTRPPAWIEEHRLPTRFEVQNEFEHLNLKANPGLPWCEHYSTKGKLLQDASDLVIDEVLRRLAKSWEEDYSRYNEVELVEKGLTDPIRTFIKNEPHPIAKLETGRYRLISNCSIVDELIFCLLYRNQNVIEILNWERIPSKPGMGLSLDSQVRSLWDSVLPWLCEATSNDVSGWDWCLQSWMFQLYAESRELLISQSPLFRRLSRNAICGLCRGVFALTDGRCYSIPGTVGLMKSGYPITASGNSVIRAMLAHLNGATKVCAMGDDCVENSDPDGLVEKYALMGVKLTDVKRDGSTFEFCSHVFIDGKAIPSNPMKSFYRLLSSPPSEQLLEQFKVQFRDYPGLDTLLRVRDMAIEAASEDRPQNNAT